VNVWEDDVPGQEERRLYFNVSGGPVVVESLDTNKKIIAAIRLQSYANDTLYSFSETMGIPAEQLSYRYYFPTYNNTWAPLNSQLRFANLESTTTRIRVTIGGVNVWEDDVPGQEERRLYFNVSGGPVVVESLDTNKKIVAAIRLQSYANGTLYSFLETMGVPEGLLSHKYYFPTYNNTWAPLNSQVRFANLETTPTTIRVTIGGTVVWEQSVPGQEERRLYFNVSGGPVIIESLDTNKKIIAAIRLQSYANNTLYSFAETMGIPAEQLSSVYYFPTYNNTWAPLNSQLRFGVP
jgi:chemotaxis receptor (MCP) glutamine deamidase CheD